MNTTIQADRPKGVQGLVQSFCAGAQTLQSMHSMDAGDERGSSALVTGSGPSCRRARLTPQGLNPTRTAQGSGQSRGSRAERTP